MLYDFNNLKKINQMVHGFLLINSIKRLGKDHIAMIHENVSLSIIEIESLRRLNSWNLYPLTHGRLSMDSCLSMGNPGEILISSPQGLNIWKATPRNIKNRVFKQ
jgi:hypothetical protein